MHPELLHLGPLTIYTYGFMMATAFMTCYFILKSEIKKIGGHPDLASNIVFWAALGGIAGAKLFYMIERFQLVLEDPVGMIFSGAGLVFHGGLIGGTIAVIVLLLRDKHSLLVFADIIGPIMLVGQGIGRIGCFFAGCCHGIACDLPWAVTFPYATPPANYPVHPTQLYETLLNFAFFFVLIKLIRPRTGRDGVTAGIYLLFAGTERFLLEFIRVNPRGTWNLTDYQFTSIFLFLAGILLLVFLTRPKTGQPISPAASDKK